MSAGGGRARRSREKRRDAMRRDVSIKGWLLLHLRDTDSSLSLSSPSGAAGGYTARTDKHTFDDIGKEINQ